MSDYIYHDPDRILYALSEEEFEVICKPTHSLWKDFCLISFSIGIPTIINAVSGTDFLKFNLTLALFLNYLFGALGILLGIVFALAWKFSHGGSEKMIKKIKSRPKTLMPSTSNLGSLDEIKEVVEELKNKPATWG